MAPAGLLSLYVRPIQCGDSAQAGDPDHRGPGLHRPLHSSGTFKESRRSSLGIRQRNRRFHCRLRSRRGKRNRQFHHSAQRRDRRKRSLPLSIVALRQRRGASSESRAACRHD